MNKNDFLSTLASLRPASTFLSIMGYRNAEEEVANYNLVFHMSYENALEKSIAIINDYTPQDEDEKLAKVELLKSWNTSLVKFKATPMEEVADDHYQTFTDDDGNPIKGVKMHKESGELHLYGLQVHKKIIVPGKPHKEVKSKSVTLAKNKLKALTPLSKFRQFKIQPNQLDAISVGKITITAADLV